MGDYIRESERQLNNENFYRKLDHNPIHEHVNLINNTLEDFKDNNELSPEIVERLKPSEPKTPRLYMLPKIHKEGNPGRPVVRSVNCHTSKISKFVDYHIQPLAKELPSYVKDTTDFINKVKDIGPLPENSYLVTMDVSSLYTNIPHDEGLDALRENLNRRRNRSVATNVLVTLMSLILTLNNFIFNGINYLQIKGCAMGTNSSPSFANIFLGKFEEQFIYPFIQDLHKLYLRYIDDIFMIWTGTKEQFYSFINELDRKHPSIKFEAYKISNTQVSFLDTTVYIDNNNKLQTTLYRKPTDRKNYLYRTSERPESLKTNIPYSQALRIRRICSTENELHHNCKSLQEKFVKRGYTKEEVSKQINKAKEKPRRDTLTQKNREKCKRIPFVTTFNRTLPPVAKIIRTRWELLHLDLKTKTSFEEPPVMAYKKCPNLRDILGSNTIESNKVKRQTSKQTTGWSKPCLARADTLCCKQVVDTQIFKSNITNRSYTIYHKLTCKSEYIIYIMECIKCKKQYVGKSEWPFNIRLNNHRKDFKRVDAIPAIRHFNQSGHNFQRDAKFTIIEQIKNLNKEKQDKRKILENKEDFWISKLKTLQPNGLNDKINHPQEIPGLIF